jgi:hypothetical protein
MAHKPDVVVAKNSGGSFLSHPEGQFAATCVDVVDFGEKVEQFPGKPERLVPKCGIVYRTGETNPENGEYIDIMREFTVSSGEKANLRQFLEAWRGKSYSGDELESGLPLHKLCGVPALITVEHKVSAGGRTYANIKAISGLPKQMAAAAPKPDGYERPKYLTERKTKYAEESQKYRAKVNAPGSRPNDDGFEGFPPESDDDSTLPF